MKNKIAIIGLIIGAIGVVFAALSYFNDRGMMPDGNDTIEELDVNLLTNKGTKDLEYTEGEMMRIRVKANKECYLQLIYYIDGDKILLLENKKITKENVDKEYELPYNFRCAAPFGKGRLQLNANTKKFRKLQIEERGENKYILDNFVSFVPEKNDGCEKNIDIYTKKK